MLVIMEKEAAHEQIEEVMGRIRALGYECHPIEGEKGVAIGATGSGRGRWSPGRGTSVA